jgi:hypothetical protein
LAPANYEERKNIMRNTLIPALLVSMLGLASAAAYAEEVKLNDSDRMELRQRADALNSGNTLGRTRDDDAQGRMMRSTDMKPVKHSKHHVKKHTRRAAKRHT